MDKSRWPALFGFALLCACSSAGADGLTTAQAAQHIGEKATVCGTVASSHYASDVEGQPTFINLDEPYPDQVFTILIWGDYRGKFATPPERWSGRLCVTGRIKAYRGKPEVKVYSPSQIQR